MNIWKKILIFVGYIVLSSLFLSIISSLLKIEVKGDFWSLSIYYVLHDLRGAGLLIMFLLLIS